jgi:hypothetical protein
MSFRLAQVSNPNNLFLQDILNFDTFTGLLTDQEQGQLMRYLSSEDVAKGAER